ncbi:MAG: EAL domain-containing protein [Synergistaceae bacterium]|nr:EAL domain-containing protein [Synergistaceae bacterium]
MCILGLDVRLGEKNTAFWLGISASPYLVIVRDSLTLAFPVIIAGAFAVLINNFPIKSYQNFMEGIFGEQWKMLGGYVWGGTLAVLALVTVSAIGYGMCAHYNAKHRLTAVHPVIVGLISLCSLMTLMEPPKEAFAIPYAWVGIHGLFLAIIVALLASKLFLWVYDRGMRLRFFTETPSAVMLSAFSSLLPGVVTIFAFAVFKALMRHFGVFDIHKLAYDLICKPFLGMGNNLGSALVFGFARQFLWFLGIHGSNALEPVMTELYSTSAAANEAALAAGGTTRFVFTKTFFDSYVTMGGAGNTLSLLGAFFIARKGRDLGTVARISILPAIFNINETLLFGIPIVLNPIFIIPFIVTPMALTVTSYMAVTIGMVKTTLAEAAWTTPALLSGWVASGGVTGSLLQIFNLALGVGIYLPFVRIADKVQKAKFEATFKELLQLSYTLGDDGGASLIDRGDDIGSLSRALANDLLHSIKKGELYLEYQPQVNCVDGRVYGVEALLRWRHDKLGRIPPSLFIPLAEEIGFIDEIGLWVCEESCRQARAWRDAGIEGVVMSFNVSVRQLDDPDLPEKIGDLLEKYNIEPRDMKIEVTESTGLSSDMGHNVLLQDIRLMGLNIAIDDFGMGHTSLVYLKQFPVSMIKLDGSLVRDIATSKISMDIIATISELCRSMDILLLAEFVETEAQARMLKDLGCFIFQGYLYSPSLAPDKCEAVIRQGFRTY